MMYVLLLLLLLLGCILYYGAKNMRSKILANPNSRQVLIDSLNFETNILKKLTIKTNKKPNEKKEVEKQLKKVKQLKNKLKDKVEEHGRKYKGNR